MHEPSVDSEQFNVWISLGLVLLFSILFALFFILSFVSVFESVLTDFRVEMLNLMVSRDILSVTEFFQISGDVFNHFWEAFDVFFQGFHSWFGQVNSMRNELPPLSDLKTEVILLIDSQDSNHIGNHCEVMN